MNKIITLSAAILLAATVFLAVGMLSDDSEAS